MIRFRNAWLVLFLGLLLPVLLPAQSSDVLLQGFNWQSHGNALGWYNVIKSKAADLDAAGIDMVWFPPASDAGDTHGYLPRELYDLGSNYGTQAQLESAIDELHLYGIKAVADIVINHRVGSTNWADFQNPTWGCWAVTAQDEWGQNGGSPCGAWDTGDNYSAARDIDHTNPTVRTDLIAWMNWLKNTVGFDGWRYDYVRGYSGYYNGLYNDATSPYFSVGELWDNLDLNNYNPHRQQIVNWINATGGKSCAFDFTTKGILQAAVQGELWRLSNNGGAPGVIGWWPAKAVTFIDNHDTGSTQNYWPFPGDKVMQGYAYILTHPGIPSVFWDHFYDWGLHDPIEDLVQIRKRNGLHSESSLSIKAAQGNLYAAEIDGKVAMKIGPGSWSPSGSGWVLAASGSDYAVWEKAPVQTTSFTVYFKKPAGWAAGAPRIHYWGAQPTGNLAASTWPGVAMTQHCGDWYKFSFANIASVNLLFHDNAGQQTPDQNRSAEGWYENGTWGAAPANPCGTVCTDTLRIHFKKPAAWGSATMYFWNPTPSGPATTWPGVQMQAEGNGWYVYELPCAQCSNVIFSNNGASQTANLSRCGEGWYNGTWHNQNPDAAPGNLTVHFRPTTYSNPKIYFWNVTPSGQATTWPGVNMTNDGNGWYSYTFANASCANFIFSNNGASQSPDLSTCTEVWIEQGNWPGSRTAPTGEAAATLRLYPNPAETHVFVETGAVGDLRIELYDMRGRLVQTAEAPAADRLKLDIAALKSGLYLYRVWTDGVPQQGKLLVK
ncbi:MAG: hypothetical protein OHK0039_27800 [Bacteroidia bacterium]